MPLYEYRCDACGHQFEVIQKFSDEPIDKCPVCGGAVRKLLSSPAIQFKGTGWYITDYAKKDSSAPASGKTDQNDSKTAAGAESKTETQSDAKAGKSDKNTGADAKPAAKTETGS